MTADADPLIRNVSDTALWAAVYRANETDRPDALFRDPYARRLAGTRGQQIAEAVPLAQRQDWAWVMRTWLFDRIIAAEVQRGVDLVVNLAAGLDVRPYRMHLPSTLTWAEVDLPPLVAEKTAALAGERPACRIERIPLDLSDAAARRALFDDLGRRGRQALVITEGLLIYLAREEAAALAEDLARPAAFQRWVLDIVSPGLVKML